MNCFLYDECNHKDCDKDFCLRRYKLNSLYDEAEIYPAFRKHKALRIDADGTDLAEFKTLANIERNITQFVNEGQNLLIYSNVCGNGKTTWAIRLVQAYFNEIWPETELVCRAYFADVTGLLLAMKANISTKDPEFNKTLEKIKTADVVVWDDIATKDGTDFEINQLLGLINTRIMQGKTNIYTANIEPAKMYEYLGPRLASRITNYSTVINLRGSDKRSQQFNQ